MNQQPGFFKQQHMSRRFKRSFGPMYSPAGPGMDFEGSGQDGMQIKEESSENNLGSRATGSTHVFDMNGGLDFSPTSPHDEQITRHFATSHGQKRNRINPIIDGGLAMKMSNKRYSQHERNAAKIQQLRSDDGQFSQFAPNRHQNVVQTLSQYGMNNEQMTIMQQNVTNGSATGYLASPSGLQQGFRKDNSIGYFSAAAGNRTARSLMIKPKWSPQRRGNQGAFNYVNDSVGLPLSTRTFTGAVLPNRMRKSETVGRTINKVIDQCQSQRMKEDRPWKHRRYQDKYSMSLIEEKQSSVKSQTENYKNLLSKMDEDQITSFNQDVLGEYHHDQPIKKGPQVSKMTLGYMNKVFGETQDKEKVRNDFFLIEQRQKKEKFLDEDELVHMAQYQNKAVGKANTLQAKNAVKADKMAKEYMMTLGEPKTAKNTGDPNSSRINVYKYIKDNEIPKALPVSGDPLALLQKVSGINPNLIKKEEKRREKRGQPATNVKYFEPPKKIRDRVNKFTKDVSTKLKKEEGYFKALQTHYQDDVHDFTSSSGSDDSESSADSKKNKKSGAPEAEIDSALPPQSPLPTQQKEISALTLTNRQSSITRNPGASSGYSTREMFLFDRKKSLRQELEKTSSSNLPREVRSKLNKPKEEQQLEITVPKVNQTKNIYQKKSIKIDRNAHDLIQKIINEQRKDQDEEEQRVIQEQERLEKEREQRELEEQQAAQSKLGRPSLRTSHRSSLLDNASRRGTNVKPIETQSSHVQIIPAPSQSKEIKSPLEQIFSSNKNSQVNTGLRSQNTETESNEQMGDKDHFATQFNLQVLQVKNTLAQAIGSRKFGNFRRWDITEDDVEEKIVKNQKSQIYEQISKKLQFYNDAKETNKKSVALDKNAAFYKSCVSARVAPAPLLSQVSAGRLNLICYQISEELAFALGEQLRSDNKQPHSKKKDPQQVDSIMLYENGLRDEGFAEILEGLTCLPVLKSLAYFGNELGHGSVTQLEEFIREDKEKQIKELRFGYLKCQPQVLEHLFETIEMFGSLQKLRISGQKLGDQIYQQPLARVVKGCKFLNELNLSDCNLSAQILVEITELLKENKSMSKLDFSLNQIAGGADEVLNATKGEENKQAVDSFIENMIFLINSNHKLFRINLEAMQLRNNIVKLGPAIKTSQSLHAVHIGSNQSSLQAQLYLCSYLGVNMRKFELDQDYSRRKQQKLPKQIDSNILSKDKQANIINVEMIKQVQRQKLHSQINEGLGTGRKIGDLLTDPLNFYRILDQPELDISIEVSNSILGPQKYTPISDWRISKSKTPSDVNNICQHHCYVLVFYKRSTRDKCLSKIKPRDLYRKVNKSYFQEAENYPKPMICGSLTNWKTVSMVRIQDYVMALDPNAKLQFDALESKHNLFKKNLPTADKKNPRKLTHLRKNFHRTLGEYRQEYMKKNWRDPFIKSFKHPSDCSMVNYPAWRENRYNSEPEQDIYVYAAFVPPGKHIAIFKDCQLPEYQQIYHQKTVVSLKTTPHTVRQINENRRPIKELETMPRNLRKFRRVKIMQMFSFDSVREDIFPDVLPNTMRNRYVMDEYTIGVAKEWIKTRSETVKEDCVCGDPEQFDLKLATLAAMWDQLNNIEAVRGQSSSFPYMSDLDMERLFTDMCINLSPQDRQAVLKQAEKETDGTIMIFECMLLLAQKLLGGEEQTSPDTLIQSLSKMYLGPLRLQCNWLLYRDQGKVWIPQKTLIIDHNLALLREMFNLFLDEGRYTYKSALGMFDGCPLVSEFSEEKMSHVFQKSILTDSISQLPQEERYLMFVEFISFLVRMIAEIYSSPASDKYHESDVRKLFLGLSEIGSMYGLSFTKPKNLDEGVAKQIKIETINHADDSDFDESLKQGTTVQTPSKQQTTLSISNEGNKEERNQVENNVATVTIENEKTLELTSRPISELGKEKIGIQTSQPIEVDFGSTYNVCGTDEEKSDEDCGYKWFESDEEQEPPVNLLADLEKIDQQRLPVKLEL